jgi:hypothetical protein
MYANNFSDQKQTQGGNIMKNKIIAILGAAAISVAAIGGVAFARGVDNNSLIANSTTAKQTAFKYSNIKVENNVKENSNDNAKYNQNSANNPSKYVYQNMIKIMRDNGFKDAARYMQTGNYAAMADYMNNLSQEDYDKMIKIMNDNGYGYMAQRMQSIGKEGMTQIHNSMMGNGSYSNGMMGNFK